ncbi:MAG: MATE family efflux transporter [Defluviitaleaceae bacterium]|nr:MATE family efflux transporter [Defluviitaleaceae bacterium]
MTDNKNKYDLTKGPILQRLVKMAMPLMANSFMQMAFNLFDMFWLSRMEGESGGPVAAAGTAGMYFWLSMAFVFVGRMGAQVGVSQNMGKGDKAEAKRYAQNAFAVGIGLGVIYGVAMIIFQTPLIGFFNMDDQHVITMAQQYLVATAIGMPLIFANHVITGVFIGFGNTKVPFIINSSTLALNIAITPLFIFTFDMGIIGAGLATVVTAAINFIAKIWVMSKYKDRPFEKYRPFGKLDGVIVKQIFKWGGPVGIESGFFTLMFMVVTRFVADFGTGAIAAQRVGSQVESLAWMMSGGFGSALAGFMGQNFGARKFGRMRRTYRISLAVMGGYGAFVGVVLFFLASPLVGIFLDCPEEIRMGAEYLQVFALTQMLACMEEAAFASFMGMGKAYKSTIVSCTSNIIRVAVVYLMVTFTDMGLLGIWVGVAISVTIRSVWLLVWYKIYERKAVPKSDEEVTKGLV